MLVLFSSVLEISACTGIIIHLHAEMLEVFEKINYLEAEVI